MSVFRQSFMICNLSVPNSQLSESEFGPPSGVSSAWGSAVGLYSLGVVFFVFCWLISFINVFFSPTPLNRFSPFELYSPLSLLILNSRIAQKLKT